MGDQLLERPGQPLKDLSTDPIRTQLLLATLFPLVLFGLLSTLVIATAFHQFSLDLVGQRNTARVQVIAAMIKQEMDGGTLPDSQQLRTAAQSAGVNNNTAVYLINTEGMPVVSSDPTIEQYLLGGEETSLLSRISVPSSQLMESSSTNDEVMVSTASIPGMDYRVVLVEHWKTIMTPSTNYQLLLAGLMLLGIVLALVTLSLAIGRIIQPIQVLAENATGAVPGSIFYPIKVYGAQEFRTLISAFNQMVIRLAEQQSALRQYSHQALLSQEEERQRISHELHDGILQDLVGLSQRVELCRFELTTDPNKAQNRLAEFHNLLNRTIDDVRFISSALRPPVLEDLGLYAAISGLCNDLTQYNPAVKCELEVNDESKRLDPELELGIYRVVQEALTNIRKHAVEATHVTVELVYGEHEILGRISNNGSMFTNQDIQEYVRSGHLGLAGMSERARLFGGVFEISSNLGEDTVVSIRMPYSQEKSSG